MAPKSLRVREPWHRRFQGLMPHRVREILLVSSSYDAFVLEEDGPLTERLFSGYSELNLTSAPRITHVSTAAEALRLLEGRRFDLVMTVIQVEDSNAADLSRSVKDRHPDIPVVLLTFDEADLKHLPEGQVPDSIERAFLWTGDANTLLAAIKLVEDLRNVGHDTSVADVQVILVVEDQMRAYSTFLGLLYPELMEQSHAMVLEAHNDRHRVVRMRARPKILLANDYEEAKTWHRWFKDHLMALITDLRFPMGGVETADAGLRLAREIRADCPDVPVLLLSSEEDLAERAEELGAWHVEKGSSAYPTHVRHFLKEALGFGDFIFRLADGQEIDRARSVWEMEQVVRRVAPGSIVHHASRHDFSVWLKARCFFETASEIRSRSVSEFADADAIREYLVAMLRRAMAQEQEGIITDVATASAGGENRFVRVGRGSIGGKARGLAFMNSIIVRHDLIGHFEGMQIRIPKTVALGIEAFERFVESTAEAIRPDGTLDRARWFESELDAETVGGLEAACRSLKGPLAVRSSNVLEDSRFQPFAGVYATYMLPNRHPHPHLRLAEILRAVKAVYASIWSDEARTYVAGTPHGVEEQRMGVVIQQVVGKRHGQRFYPLLSGVAQSRNYYPVGPQRAEDGVVVLALGMGETVVRGGSALRFSPACPLVLPQFPNARAFSRLSQTRFYAVDLARPELDPLAPPVRCLSQHDLAAAEADGTLAHVGSVYCAEDDVLRDNLALAGPRVVTMSNVLRWNAFPLAEALHVILPVLRDEMGGEVEVEFAVDEAGVEGRPPRLYLLQLRPMPPQQLGPLGVDLDKVPEAEILLRSHQALGHGKVDGVMDVIYVRRDDLGSRDTKRAAIEVREIAATLQSEARPYLLIGPGRWGTSDHSLGIPVDWRDITGARVIVETPLGEREVEPSQGSHFFHNVTAMRIGYLTISRDPMDRYERAWLDAREAATETELVRHVRLDAPLGVHMDGLAGRAVVLRQPEG